MLLRNYIEALTAANKAAVGGVQALAARQNEILQENLREAIAAVSELSKVAGRTAQSVLRKDTRQHKVSGRVGGKIEHRNFDSHQRTYLRNPRGSEEAGREEQEEGQVSLSF